MVAKQIYYHLCASESSSLYVSEWVIIITVYVWVGRGVITTLRVGLSRWVNITVPVWVGGLMLLYVYGRAGSQYHCTCVGGLMLFYVYGRAGSQDHRTLIIDFRPPTHTSTV